MNLRPLEDVAIGNQPYSSLVPQVRIDTALTPPIIINNPLASNASGPPSPFMQFLKPQITITSPVLDQPSVRAPYGVPTRNYWPEVKIGIVALAGLGAFGLAMLLFGRR